jgi:hypothetical protein
VIYYQVQTIGDAIKNHWKLKSIDSVVGFKDDDNIPMKERRRIIDQMIGEDNQLKEILHSR